MPFVHAQYCCDVAHMQNEPKEKINDQQASPHVLKKKGSKSGRRGEDSWFFVKR